MEQKAAKQESKPEQKEATPEEVRAILGEYLKGDLPDNDKPRTEK